MQRTFAILALTTLSIVGWSMVRSQRRLASSGQSPALQTWEGEGGGLPDGGPGERTQPVASVGSEAAVYADAAQRAASA